MDRHALICSLLHRDLHDLNFEDKLSSSTPYGTPVLKSWGTPAFRVPSGLVLIPVTISRCAQIFMRVPCSAASRLQKISFYASPEVLSLNDHGCQVVSIQQETLVVHKWSGLFLHMESFKTIFGLAVGLAAAEMWIDDELAGVHGHASLVLHLFSVLYYTQVPSCHHPVEPSLDRVEDPDDLKRRPFIIKNYLSLARGQ